MPEFYQWSGNGFQKQEMLLDALELEVEDRQMKYASMKISEHGRKMNGERPCRVISIVGAGGKTSTMFQLAKEYAGMGKRVIVTTSTHILKPDGYKVILEEQPRWLEGLMEFAKEPGGGILVTAAKENDWKNGNFPDDKAKKKLKGMEPQKIGKLLEYCDVLLIEADGSKGLPVKVPAEHEPVIIPETQVVIGCAGLMAVGKRVQDVCFRREQLEQMQKEKMTEKFLANIMLSESGTRKGVDERDYRILLNQMDGILEKCAAERTAEWIDCLNQESGRTAVKIAASCYL